MQWGRIFDPRKAVGNSDKKETVEESRCGTKDEYLRLHSSAGGGLNMCHNGLLHESQFVGMWKCIGIN